MMVLFIFFFNDTATTEIYTLSLHDALPIWIAPAIRRAHAPVAERPRRGERAEAPDRFRRPARMRTEAPVHRRSEEHTSELQSQSNLVCRLLLEKKNRNTAPCACVANRQRTG